MDEVGVDAVGVPAGRRLVRVVDGREPAEAGLDVAVRRVEGDAQVRVEGPLPPEVVVGFVDGVEEVEGYDEDVDAPPVLGEAGGAGPGFGVAGADGDAVVDCLDPACYQLEGGTLEWCHLCAKEREEELTLGRNVHPIRERRLDMLAGLGYGIAREILGLDREKTRRRGGYKVRMQMQSREVSPLSLIAICHRQQVLSAAYHRLNLQPKSQPV